MCLRDHRDEFVPTRLERTDLPQQRRVLLGCARHYSYTPHSSPSSAWYSNSSEYSAAGASVSSPLLSSMSRSASLAAARWSRVRDANRSRYSSLVGTFASEL